ncbi:MAG: AAA family ATPase [Candidatus Dormibacteraeota bacterium]|nr:AAA family ATPase [Candidatus Dormibacteraeota bacterium]
MAELDAESAAELMNQALAEMAGPIFRYGGKIDRFLGDGLLAYFGAPEAHEDDPERAILAALEIEQRLRQLGLRSTAGINSGEVYLGSVGTSAHRELTAMGPAVNLASRLQASAQPGEVLVGDSVERHARRSFEFRPTDLRVKGLSQPVRAFYVVAPLSRLERVRGLEGRRAPMIGRDAEVKSLLAAVARLRTGEGQVVLIIGEAGLGKSRLLTEVQRQVETTGESARWLEGRCLSLTSPVSYAPLIDALRTYFGIPNDLDHEQRGDRVRTRLAALVQLGAIPSESVEDVAPVIGSLLGVRFGTDWDQRLTGATPDQLKNRMFRALELLFLAAARERPLVLVLEDLHWSDGLSQEVLPCLMHLTTVAPLLLICVYRPESEPCSRLTEAVRQAHRDTHLELRMSELSDEESGELIDALLQVEDFPAGLRDRILTRSQGNPFFVEELVRSLIESDLIVQEGGRFRAGTGIERFPVPEAVQTVIQGRVDRLTDESRQILQLASVVGRVFRRRVMEVVHVASRELDRALDDLQQRSLISIERPGPDPEYTFHHVLTQETVYNNLLRSDRARLHREVAAAIEGLFPAEVDAHVEELAHHYDLAGDVALAVDYRLKAGEKAARNNLAAQAAKELQRGLALLETQRFADERPAWYADRSRRLNEALADLLAITGQHEAAQAGYERALEHSSFSDHIDRARLLRKSADNWRLRLRDDRASADFDAATTALDGYPDRSLGWWHEWIELALTRIRFHYFRGDVDDLTRLVDQVAAVIDEHGTSMQRGRLLDARVLLAFRLERYRPSDRTLSYVNQYMARMQAEPDPAKIGYANFLIGFTSWMRWDLSTAEAHLRLSLAAAERYQDAWLRTASLAYLTTTFRNQGVGREVERFVHRALEAAVKTGLLEYEALAQGHLAWLAWRGRRSEAVKEHARRAQDLWHAWARRSREYPFAWAAAWPMVGAALEHNDASTVIKHVRAILGADKQPPPEELSQILEQAVARTDAHDHEGALRLIRQAMPMATRVGYL